MGLVVVAAPVDQRLAFRLVLGFQHFADEDQVIAFLVLAFAAAGQPGGDAAEQRRAVALAGELRALAFFEAGAGEQAAQVLLLPAQHLDGEALGGKKAGGGAGLLAQAPQDQRGFQRYRAEGVDGQAQRAVVGVQHRGDGDAGGEAAQGLAQ